MRASMTNVSSYTGKVAKQNSQSEIYQLDPKILQLKKKYQLENKMPVNSNYSGHRHTSSLRQQQVLRKLENIKSELQLIPDWQNYARSILFEGKSQVETKKVDFSIPEYSRSSIKLSSKYMPQSSYIRQENQTFQESRALNNSNISFKINHTVSIQRPESRTDSRTDSRADSRTDSRTDYTYKDKSNMTPVKISNQFKKNGDYQYYAKNNKFLKQKASTGVDDKINEISRKIRESQMKKKTLGVDFVPFEDKSAQKRGQSPKYLNQQSYKGKTPEKIFQKNCSSIQRINYRPPRPASTTISNFHYDGVSKNLNGKQHLKQSSISPRFAQTQNQQMNLFSYNKKMRSNSVHENYENKPKIQAYLEEKKYEDKRYEEKRYEDKRYDQKMMQASKNNKMLYEAENALKERKKKVQVVEEKKRTKQQTKKLVQAFCQQVKLDEKYRNCKLWFKAYRNEKKINRLKSLLELEGVKLSEQKINSEFEVQQKEDNPFFSVSSQQCDVQQVAKSYIECEKYWKKHLYKRFNRQALEAEGFSNLSVDLDKKGYLVLEDLVRFLNMETGTFFRNRDLFTIFKRMSNNSGKVSFKDFIYTFYA